MEYEHGAENQPMDGNPSMCGPSETATHIARADCPHLSDPVGGTPKTGQSHWGDGRRDDATDVVTDRATRCCSGLHSQGASRRCYRYDYDGVVWDDTTRAVIETAREQLSSKDKTTFKLLKLQTLGHVTESDLKVRETRLGHYRRLVGAP
ncbi:hypothetical protein PI124_g22788 [Phytophthora idaei]|nr:hypothetical protein PI124_g22788 [Phytophthora idaei]